LGASDSINFLCGDGAQCSHHPQWSTHFRLPDLRSLKGPARGPILRVLGQFAADEDDLDIPISRLTMEAVREHLADGRSFTVKLW